MKIFKIIPVLCCCLPVLALAEVQWDISIKEMGKYTDLQFLFDLKKGETANIDIEDAIFCTLNSGALALTGTTFLREQGDFRVKMIAKNRVEIKTTDEKAILNDLIEYDGFARCQHWTPNHGKYAVTIDNINGKTKISDLSKTSSVSGTSLQALESLLESIKETD